MINRKGGIFFAEVYSASEKVASITWNRLPLSRFAERMSADFFRPNACRSDTLHY